MDTFKNKYDSLKSKTMASLTQGLNTLKVRGKTRAGVWGDVFSFQINLDTNLPIIANVNIEPPTGWEELQSSQTSFTVSVADIWDDVSGVKSTTFSWSRDGVVFTDSVEYDGVRYRHEYTNKDLKTGKIYAKVQVEDNAGNVAETTVQRDVLYDGVHDYSGTIDNYSNQSGQGRWK